MRTSPSWRGSSTVREKEGVVKEEGGLAASQDVSMWWRTWALFKMDLRVKSRLFLWLASSRDVPSMYVNTLPSITPSLSGSWRWHSRVKLVCV